MNSIFSIMFFIIVLLAVVVLVVHLEATHRNVQLFDLKGNGV